MRRLYRSPPCADDMKQRLELDEGSQEAALALEAMTEVGLSKLEKPTSPPRLAPARPRWLSVRGQIPAAYWVPQPPKLDRQALLGVLKRGDRVPGLNSATRSRCSP